MCEGPTRGRPQQRSPPEAPLPRFPTLPGPLLAAVVPLLLAAHLAPKASVEFEAQASGVREMVSQSLDLRGVRPGRYLLTGTITAGDQVGRRERRITVAASR